MAEPADALGVLKSVEAEGHAQQGERYALMAASFTRLEQFDAAEGALTNARAYAYGSFSLALEAEVEYFAGLIAFAQGDLAQFEASSHRILAFVGQNESFGEAVEYAVPLAHTRARAYEALGAVELARGRYHDQAAYSRKALREMDEAPVGDVWIVTSNVLNLAVLAGHYDLFEHVEYLRERLAAIPWTEELAERRFTALDAFGWHLALRGDNIGAFRQFRISMEAAVSVPDRIFASVSRAQLSYELGHEPIAVEELEHALEMSRAVNWERTVLAQRTALLNLAEAAATIAPDAARAALDRYRKIRSRLSTLSLARVEPWIVAVEDYTEGLIARADGNRLKAIDAFVKAHHKWSACGLEWRAARAAIELAELGAGECFVREARREAVKRPASWMARRVAKLPD